jgi:hemerythrin
MRQCRFPAIGEHEREHLRVLGELAHFSRAAKGGRLNLAHAYVKDLPGWFATHLATMDSALAACLKKAVQ